eukprot:509826_1
MLSSSFKIMSKKWISMTWKQKDLVFVNKKSWESQSTLVEYKYDASHSKTYKGSRSNFSSPKKTKSKKKITSSKFNNNSNTINNNTQNNQKKKLHHQNSIIIQIQSIIIHKIIKKKNYIIKIQ